ncbi:MAG: hypothetical protein KC445_18400 [Anaerolineales bacterium]|nr:hypothetical protein [Anaerolineales bacterium]
MRRWLWGTAVFIITILGMAVSCGSGEPTALPEVTGPAFVFFYTDN